MELTNLEPSSQLPSMPRIGRAALVLCCLLPCGSALAEAGNSTSPFVKHYERLLHENKVQTIPPALGAIREENSVPLASRNSLGSEDSRHVENSIKVKEPINSLPNAGLRNGLTMGVTKSDRKFLDKSRDLQSMRRGEVTDEQSLALLDFISTNDSAPNDQTDLQYLSLKNDALVCLIEQDPLHVELGGVMLSLVKDTSQDALWREYVLQHYGLFYRARWPVVDDVDVGETEAKERRDFQETLATALFHEDSGLAGTALIVIEDLAMDYPEFQGDVLRRAALRVAKSPLCGMTSRVTALSILGGESQDEESLKMIADVAQNVDESLALRITATGQLARRAKSDMVAKEKLQNVAWLSNQSNHKEKRLKGVAERHLLRLDGELNMNDSVMLTDENDASE